MPYDSILVLRRNLGVARSNKAFAKYVDTASTKATSTAGNYEYNKLVVTRREPKPDDGK